MKAAAIARWQTTAPPGALGLVAPWVLTQRKPPGSGPSWVHDPTVGDFLGARQRDHEVLGDPAVDHAVDHEGSPCPHQPAQAIAAAPQQHVPDGGPRACSRTL